MTRSDVPFVFTQNSEMGQLPIAALVEDVTTFQRSGHQVAQVEIGRGDLRRQRQFEIGFGR